MLALQIAAGTLQLRTRPVWLGPSVGTELKDEESLQRFEVGASSFCTGMQTCMQKNRFMGIKT